MGWFTGSSKKVFPWIELTGSAQLRELIEQSHEKPLIVFKHSTRCSISSMALNRFESQMDSELACCAYLDLLSFRSLSDEIAQLTGVIHQSPQLLIWKNGEVVYHASHSAIDVTEIKNYI